MGAFSAVEIVLTVLVPIVGLVVLAGTFYLIIRSAVAAGVRDALHDERREASGRTLSDPEPPTSPRPETPRS